MDNSTQSCHRIHIVFILNESYQRLLKFDIENLSIEIISGLRLQNRGLEKTRLHGRRDRTAVIPKVPIASWNSATSKLGVDGFPRMMAPV